MVLYLSYAQDLQLFPLDISEQLDALMGSLNCKGERERTLKQQLEKFYSRIRLVLNLVTNNNMVISEYLKNFYL